MTMTKTERLSLRLMPETVRQIQALARGWITEATIAPLSKSGVVAECVRDVYERTFHSQETKTKEKRP